MVAVEDRGTDNEVIRFGIDKISTKVVKGGPVTTDELRKAAKEPPPKKKVARKTSPKEKKAASSTDITYILEHYTYKTELLVNWTHFVKDKPRGEIFTSFKVPTHLAKNKAELIKELTKTLEESSTKNPTPSKTPEGSTKGPGKS